jgi:hypothetical protein
MSKTPRNKELDDLLAAYAPPIRDLALAARKYLLEMFPGVIETVEMRPRIIGYGYGPRYVDMVCALMPTKAGVTLGIGYATELPDPKKILEGTGRVHRHVKLKNESDLKSSALRALLKAAGTRARGAGENNSPQRRRAKTKAKKK